MKKTGILLIFLMLFSSFLFAEELSPEKEKRPCFSPDQIPKVTIEGIKYTVLDEAFEKITQDDRGRVFENYIGGNLYAIDLLTNWPKWKVNVYKETGVAPLQYKVKTGSQTIEPLLESACLVKVEFQDKKVVVTNRRGEKFEVNLKDKSVKLLGEKKPQVIYE
ncbi:MAG: hypothetical protein HQM15_09090 [Deltaproteobacteria bacterium]|nr:hypothetical protein [Deltaproteobacteria bacterium]